MNENPPGQRKPIIDPEPPPDPPPTVSPDDDEPTEVDPPSGPVRHSDPGRRMPSDPEGRGLDLEIIDRVPPS